MSSIEIALRVMRVFDGFGGPSCDQVWWRTDGDYSPVTMIVNCNDLFFWACADAESITEDNIGILEESLKELSGSEGEPTELVPELFCCRVRGMRPQPPYYRHIPDNVRHLFDACGPER